MDVRAGGGMTPLLIPLRWLIPIAPMCPPPIIGGPRGGPVHNKPTFAHTAMIISISKEAKMQCGHRARTAERRRSHHPHWSTWGHHASWRWAAWRVHTPRHAAMHATTTAKRHPTTARHSSGDATAERSWGQCAIGWWRSEPFASCRLDRVVSDPGTSQHRQTRHVSNHHAHVGE